MTPEPDNASTHNGYSRSRELSEAQNHPNSTSDSVGQGPPRSNPFSSFQSNTIAPSPPAQMKSSAGSDSRSQRPPAADFQDPNNALRISTDVTSTSPAMPSFPHHRDLLNGGGERNLSPSRIPLNRTTSANSIQLSRTPSLKAALTNSYGAGGGSGSNVPSPIITAMGDVTPLPSPLMSGDSPGPWKRLSISSASPTQRSGRLEIVEEGAPANPNRSHVPHHHPNSPTKRKLFITEQTDNIPPPLASPLGQRQGPQHGRNRSVSEYVPEAVSMPKRPVAVSGSHARIETAEALESTMRREMHLAESRGLTQSVTKPPTPPPSESSRDSSDGTTRQREDGFEYFKARSRSDQKKRRWRSLGLLGRGTFSRVMLATSQIVPSEDGPEIPTPSLADCRLDRKTLVAVKVCEHGPRGGASEDRIEMSLKRELEIMQVIHHPCLVDLKAWSIEHTRAILVMSYCPGGDLFDLATAHRSLLEPSLMARMFAELVAAVNYLHEKSIVHRDIKLENVLVNIRAAELANQTDWSTYPYSVITLADLGLSRRVADGEQLETRCGSDDYAAPEVIMGQQYDGRATDAWSLGVLLYALLEARLPFDPHPGMSEAHRMRSRTSHRIARVEWRWVEYAGEDGDHEGDEAKFQQRGLLGAMQIVEGLLKRARSRWTLDKVAKQQWIADAVRVDGGLRFHEEYVGEEVS